MKYRKEFKIAERGTSLVVHLTEAAKAAGMPRGTPVYVSVTDDDKIEIEKINK